MSEPRTIPREEAFAFIARTGTAVLAGEPMPHLQTSGDYMRAEDMADAMNAFMQSVAEHFDDVPARVSGDVTVREIVRQELDKVFSSVAAGIGDAIAMLQARRAS